ncbi:MAG: sigma 54-interacting transcriptional regulator [Victivallales bacterium]|nr:sigma 54-interacting transcriptional regulator [Victivallales bacterium]
MPTQKRYIPHGHAQGIVQLYGLWYCGISFLDEICELPLQAQGLLLRVLAESRFQRLGENTGVVVVLLPFEIVFICFGYYRHYFIDLFVLGCDPSDFLLNKRHINSMEHIAHNQTVLKGNHAAIASLLVTTQELPSAEHHGAYPAFVNQHQKVALVYLVLIPVETARPLL